MENSIARIHEQYGLSEAQVDLLSREPEVMSKRPEAGRVYHLHGSGQHRTGNALVRKGVCKMFSLAPYEGMFLRVIV